MASKKAGGSTTNGRDSNPKYRGVKKFGGEQVIPGNIIVRQCGNSFHAGSGVACGRDYTLYALVSGKVAFRVGANNRRFVSIEAE
jgi:large subunit ribosomal protein L27